MKTADNSHSRGGQIEEERSSLKSEGTVGRARKVWGNASGFEWQRIGKRKSKHIVEQKGLIASKPKKVRGTFRITVGHRKKKAKAAQGWSRHFKSLGKNPLVQGGYLRKERGGNPSVRFSAHKNRKKSPIPGENRK